jgi:hypothetical protein
MGGAYTAKPDVVPEVDYPPGWNINWPYPGPFPPGFSWQDLPEAEDLPEEEQDDNGDPIPRILVFPTSGVYCYEHDDGVQSYGAETSFIVMLTARPTQGSITIPFTVGEESATPSYGGVTFTDTNWNIPRKINLAGWNNNIVSGDRDATVTVGPSTSSAVDYEGLYGHSVDATNYEIVNKIIAIIYPHDIDVGYAPNPIAGDAEWWEDGPREDWIVVRLSIYEVAPGVTDLQTIVESGLEVAYRNAIYTHDDGVVYEGTSSQYGGFSTVAENLQPDKKYVVVTSLWIDGTYEDSSCSIGGETNYTRIFFYHAESGEDDVILEDYHATGEQVGEFGKEKFLCWAQLDNSDTEPETKLDKLTTSYEDVLSDPQEI